MKMRRIRRSSLIVLSALVGVFAALSIYQRWGIPWFIVPIIGGIIAGIQMRGYTAMWNHYQKQKEDKDAKDAM